MSYKLRIKEVAKAKGMNMADIYYKSGISQATLSRILAKKQSPSLDMIDRIATALDCTISDLLITDYQYIECPHCHKLVKVEVKK